MHTLSALLIVLALTPQAGQAIKSGLQPGQLLPGPFHPLNVTGLHAGRPHCIVCQFGLRPTAAVFLTEPAEKDKPTGALLKGLDAMYSARIYEMGAFADFLTEDAGDYDKTQAFSAKLKEMAKTLELGNLIVAIDGAEGPMGYNLNKDAAVTVILYDKQKVVASYAFAKDGMTDKDVQQILAEMQKLLPAKKKR